MVQVNVGPCQLKGKTVYSQSLFSELNFFKLVIFQRGLLEDFFRFGFNELPAALAGLYGGNFVSIFFALAATRKNY